MPDYSVEFKVRVEVLAESSRAARDLIAANLELQHDNILDWYHYAWDTEELYTGDPEEEDDEEDYLGVDDDYNT